MELLPTGEMVAGDAAEYVGVDAGDADAAAAWDDASSGNVPGGALPSFGHVPGMHAMGSLHGLSTGQTSSGDKLVACLRALMRARDRHPHGLSLDELEEATKLPLRGDASLLASLRENGRVAWTSTSGRFKYVAELAGSERTDILRHLRQSSSGHLSVSALSDMYTGAGKDVSSLTRSGGFPMGPDGGLIRIHNVRAGVKEDVLFHRSDVASSGSDVRLRQVTRLSGTLSLRTGSRIATSTHDLTMELFRNDLILIDSRPFRVSSEHTYAPYMPRITPATHAHTHAHTHTHAAAVSATAPTTAGVAGASTAAQASPATSTVAPSVSTSPAPHPQKRPRLDGAAQDATPALEAQAEVEPASDNESRDHDQEDEELFASDDEDGGAALAPGPTEPAAPSPAPPVPAPTATPAATPSIAAAAPSVIATAAPSTVAAVTSTPLTTFGGPRYVGPEFGIYTTSIGNAVRNTGGWFSVADTGAHQLKSGAAYAQPFTATSVPLDRAWDGPDMTGVVAYRVGAASDLRVLWRLMVNCSSDDIADATGYTESMAAVAALAAASSASISKSTREFLHQLGGAASFRAVREFPKTHRDLRRAMLEAGLGETPMLPGTLEGEDPSVTAKRQGRTKRVRKPNERSLRIQSNQHIMDGNDAQARTLRRIRYQQVAQEYTNAKAALNQANARAALDMHGLSAAAAAAKKL